MAAIGVPVAGMPFVHDPSTVVRFHGSITSSPPVAGPRLLSPDTITWTREGSVFTAIPDAVHAAVPKNNGTDVWAPDIIRLNNQFYLYYAVSSWGSFQSAIGLATNPVLDPRTPPTSGPTAAWSSPPTAMRTSTPSIPASSSRPTTRSGSATARTTAASASPSSTRKPASHSRPRRWAPDCNGARVRGLRHHLPRRLLLPLRQPRKLLQGKQQHIQHPRRPRAHHHRAVYGSRWQANVRGRRNALPRLRRTAHRPWTLRPRGRLRRAAERPERFSIHYEADLSRGGRSVLDIRPLQWSPDGWPIAGDNAQAATH